MSLQEKSYSGHVNIKGKCKVQYGKESHKALFKVCVQIRLKIFRIQTVLQTPKGPKTEDTLIKV